MKQKIKEIFALFRKEDDAPINSVMEYRERMKRLKTKAFIKTTAIVVLAVSAVLFIKYEIDHWTYDGYEIITDEIQDTVMSAKYTDFGENILKYGGDEIALLNRQEEILWTYSATQNAPVVEVCENACLVYDKKGTTFSVFNMDGQLGQIHTTLPILKAKVAKQGVVAAILEDGDTTWVNVYDTDGEIIVTSKTRMESPGYPIDISLSSDGLLMGVSYVKVENNKISTYVTFYNFGHTGQNQVDNVVSTYSYGDTLIPDIEYLDEKYAVAFSENGFYIYKGQQIPDEQNKVTVDSEIISVFHDASNIGMILRNKKSEAPYVLELYNLKGKKKWSVPLESLFDTVKISQDEILLYNSTNFAVYSMKGICRFEGAIEEGAVDGLFKIARNRYLAVLDSGIETFKLTN